MSDAKLVYSTDGSHKQLCAKCEKTPCGCAKPAAIDPKGTTLKIRLETHGRGGKSVTVVFDLPRNETFCENETKRLKNLCGSGGTYKDGRIEVQGDHRERIKAYFEKCGFKVKLAGG